ncbi:PACE efflux transporter [Dongshaea marina]|uniref:PACE efflux transporter n=1 Tax=Dongshaea marina TaxID=2047966 RepID=UPI000D3E62F5|nr:PACE efflux transporter [Dongshaea marina]
MRSYWDRMRHVLLFEVIGLILVIPLSTTVFKVQSTHMGILAIGFALFAPIWNFFYNLWFDKLMLLTRGSTRKTMWIRGVHAICFELGMLIIALPITAWWLNVSLLQALIMDIALALFYVVYAYIFNWCYDLVFPIPESEAAPQH